MIGKALGPYEIVGKLGEGGMGEVYRAHDAKLRRDVAIKVLPASVAGDAERLMRFEREAQALAALNHPNIATIYGLEQGAIVMELVEGQTLAERVADGTMPWRDALAVARQIADALEAAHDKGIVHRDLKPANIKLTPEGVVKVLDFGLAKALDPASGSGSVSNSPTLTARATQMGVILGTAAYMSPEQARGRAVDRRADIWAFGCVLFEMVTGRRVFEGEEVTDVLARLIEREPDWAALPSDTDPRMRQVLERCLTKDPKARLRDIGEARITIEEAMTGKVAAVAAAPGPRAASRWSRVLPWALASALAVVAAVFALRPPATPAAGMNRLARVDLNLPADVEFFAGPSVSDDGTTFAFIGVRQGLRQVYLRRLDTDATTPVTGTDAATSAAISPKGTSVAFITTDLWLKRINLSTGIVEPIANGAEILSRPVWMGDDAIVFSRGTRLVHRPLAGTEERALAVADEKAGEVSLSWPATTDDGSLVLFSVRSATPRGMSYRLESIPTAGGARRLVMEGAEQILAVTGGYLIYKQGEALFAVRHDTSTGATIGAPTRLGESFTMTATGTVSGSASRAGDLLTAPPTVTNGRLVWVSAAGVERPASAATRGFQNPRVSPDGRLIAFSDLGTIWTLDPARGTFARVSPGTEPNVGFPAWSHDGTRLYYRSPEGLRLQRADGEGQATVLPNTQLSDYPGSVTPDGRTLVFLRIQSDTGGDIYATPAEGGEVTPILATKAYEGGPLVSPDGKWLLYVSNESGRMEIYVRPLAGGDRKWPVSGDGGLHPLWSKDGRRIFYRSGQRMMAVDFSAGPDVRLGTPVEVFERRYEFGPNITFANYSLSADGPDFLMVREAPGGRHLNLVLNWLQSVGR